MEPTIVIPMKQELETLKRQVQSAIEMEEVQKFKQMSEREIREHVQKYGAGTFLIGDYVIKRR